MAAPVAAFPDGPDGETVGASHQMIDMSSRVIGRATEDDITASGMEIPSLKLASADVGSAAAVLARLLLDRGEQLSPPESLAPATCATRIMC